jgi:TonB-linked SusC/RagA family outer membrane protein
MKKIGLLLALLVFAGINILYAQNMRVTGTVTSAEDGTGIPGATVKVKGGTTGVVTDADGKYSISANANATLVFSFVGTKTEEVQVAGQNVINVTLKSDVVGLDEVVVTAMGISREKKSLGYAVQEVKSDELTKASNPDIATAIQGKVSGVEVRQSSGMPGAPSQIFIRGARSFSGNNAPLYVVDGMPISSDADYSMGQGITGSNFSNRSMDIDPNDIESISVLKGQAASALYGMRASNGVIVITTKKGKNAPMGKPVVNIAMNGSADEISRLPELQQKYAQGVNGAFDTGNSSSWGPLISDLPNDSKYGGNVTTSFPIPSGVSTSGKYWSRQKQAWITPQAYNNPKAFFKTGYTLNTNVNVSQAGSFGNYSLGIGATNQKGIVTSTGMDRYTAKMAGDFNMSDKWKIGFSGNYAESNVDKLPSGNSSYLFTVYGAPVSYDLMGSPYYEEGNPYKQLSYRKGSFDNPIWATKNNVFNEKNHRFFGNAYTQYIPTDWFNIRYQLGIDSYSTDFEDVYELGSAPTGGATFNVIYPSPSVPSGGSINNYGTIRRDVNSLLTFNLDKKFGDDFRLTAMAGNEIVQKYTRNWSMTGTGFNIGGWHNMANTNTQTAGEDKYKNRTVGFFANAGLDWKRMLFLNVTGRNDIVSAMPKDNRSFFYPSASLGWIFTELEPLKENSVLSYGKVRGSYAEVGQGASAFYSPYYTSASHTNGFLQDGHGIYYPFNGISGYTQSSTIYDPKLKPQNTKSFELGAELKFFNNRIGIDYTYTHQNTVDQIFSVPMAGSTGFSQVVTNGGRMVSDVHEVVLNFTPIKLQNFEWNSQVNFTTTKNECKSLAPNVNSIFLGGFVDPQVRAAIGTTFPAIYGTAFERDSKGRIMIDDDPASSTYGYPLMAADEKVIGKVTPKFIMGFNNEFRYKFVKLSALIEWKNGGQIYSGSNRLIDLYGVSKKTEDRTSTVTFSGVKASTGEINDIKRGGAGDKDFYQDYYWNYIGDISEAHIYKTSFVKLREISLSIDLPKKWLEKADIQGLSLNFFARNILLWTSLPNFDPETSQGDGNMAGGFDYMSLPQTKSFGMGLNLTF